MALLFSFQFHTDFHIVALPESNKTQRELARATLECSIYLTWQQLLASIEALIPPFLPNENARRLYKIISHTHTRRSQCSGRAPLSPLKKQFPRSSVCIHIHMHIHVYVYLYLALFDDRRRDMPMTLLSAMLLREVSVSQFDFDFIEL